MDYFKQFQKHIQNHDYPEFLTLWEEYCLGDEIDPKELKKTLQLVKDSDLSVPFGRHVENALVLWEKLQDEPFAHEIFKLIIDLQTTNTPELGNLTFTYLQNKYGQSKHFNEKIRLIGLRERQDFKGAVRNFELLNHINGGSFVYHNGGWGVGEIMDVSFLREQISLEFDYVPGLKDLSFQNAFNTLTPIPNDHFLARRFGNPDDLEILAKKDPVGVIRMALKDLGPLSAAEIKDELCGLVIQEEEWAKWWQSTRAKIKKDTLIEVPSGLRHPFKLREEEVSHEDTLQTFLEKKPTSATLIQMVYAFIRDFPATLKNPEFRKSLQEKLTDALANHELTDAQELQIHYFLQDLTPEQELHSVEELIKRFSSVQDVINDISIIAFKKRTLQDVRKVREDWTPIFIDLLVAIEQNPIRDFILQELVNAGFEEEIKNRLNELLAFPAKQPQAFMWYFQKIMAKNAALPYSDEDGRQQFFESMLILLSQIEQSPSAREHVKKIHAFITNGRFANVRKIYEYSPKEIVQEFLLLATKCHSLTSHDIKILHSLAEVVHPSLKTKKSHTTTEEEEPLWTTQEGYEKLQERIKQIATVETVENAKEIEEARSHGDLRENSEYKYALEKRDRLQNELKTLSIQLNRARVLAPEDVSLDEVGVGAVVECVGNGDQVSYTLLGPWEADPDKHILSFQSKLAQSMAGKTVGEKVSIQGKDYTIKQIRNYFES